MSRPKKHDRPKFGTPEGPKFSQLRVAGIATPTSVAEALASWRSRLDEQVRTAPDDNLGWLRVVYLVPPALARAWQQLASVDVVTQHDWAGRKRCRVRGIIGFDDAQWISSAGGPSEGTTAHPADDVALTQMITPKFATEAAGGVYSWTDRQDEALVRKLGRNFFAVGPVYGKTGDEDWALGYNVRCIPVEGLELGQWFKITLPPAPTW